MSEKPNNFFPDNHLPHNIILHDPSHLRAAEITKLWDHWFQHQQKNLVGLSFIGCDERDCLDHQMDKGKGRRAILEDELSLGESDGEEETAEGSQPPETEFDAVDLQELLTEQQSDHENDHNSVFDLDPSSPAAVLDSKEAKLSFLKLRSKERKYQDMLKGLEDDLVHISRLFFCY